MYNEDININDNELFLGLDENGKGCILGHLYLTGVIISKKQINDFENKNNINFKDSKNYSYFKIKEYYELLKDNIIKLKVIRIKCKLIDKYNINLLLLSGYKKLITFFLKDYNKILNVSLDSFVDEKIKKYKIYKSFLSKNISNNFTMINKADSKLKEVAIASIIGKYIREKYMIKLKKYISLKYNIDIGSGYLSDIRTKNNIKSNLDFLLKDKYFFNNFRFKWTFKK